MAGDGGVYIAWAVATLLALIAYAVGSLVGNRTGIIDPRAPRLETVGLGLGLGLIVVAAGYAVIGSRAASTYTVCFASLVAAAVIGRAVPRWPAMAMRSLPVVALSLLLLPVFGALFGLTAAPSPRDGVQPIEFMDEAYYAVLSVELRESAVESVYAPAGFGTLPGTPVRSWYHWGEIWLASLALEFPGVTPMHARHQIVLPLLILATALLGGSLVRILAPQAGARRAAVLGAFGMLTLAPIPLVLALHFDWWARPIGFAVTQYGLAYVVVLVGLLTIATRRGTTGSWSTAIAAGGLAAALVASHILVAATAAVGLIGAAAARWVATRGSGKPVLGATESRAVVLSLVLILGTVAWGVSSGHGFGGGSSVQGVEPFASSWWRAVMLVLAGSGALGLGLVAAFLLRGSQATLFALGAGACIAVAAGAVVWGVRLADFNSFHAFYGPLAIILTPLAMAAFVAAMAHARRSGHGVAATLLLALFATQGAIGIAATIQRLYEFGPGHYRAVPLTALEYVRALPPEARLAYACAPVEEVAVWDARLISLTAHAGRAVVPMCFQADVFGPQLGVSPPPGTPGPFFSVAPQRELYPSIDSRPSLNAVRAFMKRHEIDYIFEDADHANTLLPGAEPVFRVDTVTIYRVP